MYHQNNIVTNVRKKATIVFDDVMSVLKFNVLIVFIDQIAAFISLIALTIY